MIVGFGLEEPIACSVFDYSEDIKGEAQRLQVKRINPYLVDAPDVVIDRRSVPICPVPGIGIGNKPIDNGNYLFTDEEKAEFLSLEPSAAQYFHRWVGAEEFINGTVRWCLWLGDVNPQDLRKMSHCLKRVDAVRKYRLNSVSPPTQKLADRPTRFHVEFLPKNPYLLIPSVSSERRQYVPIGFLTPDVFSSNLVLTIPDATMYHFAVLNSVMHNAWLRSVGGRLKSDYRYSASVVYNNFPWPSPDKKQHEAIEAAGQGILVARKQFPGSTLADLYDPLTMPPELRKAHDANDRAVDLVYGYKGKKSDAARVAFLFDLYEKLTSLPLKHAEEKKASRKKK